MEADDEERKEEILGLDRVMEKDDVDMERHKRRRTLVLWL